jgi:hypothetical protein
MKAEARTGGWNASGLFGLFGIFGFFVLPLARPPACDTRIESPHFTHFAFPCACMPRICSSIRL